MAILHPYPRFPFTVNNSLSLMFTPGFFYTMGSNNISQMDTTTKLYVRLTFNLNNTYPNSIVGDSYLNNSGLILL